LPELLARSASASRTAVLIDGGQLLLADGLGMGPFN